jgi:hypothetical protein
MAGSMPRSLERTFGCALALAACEPLPREPLGAATELTGAQMPLPSGVVRQDHEAVAKARIQVTGPSGGLDPEMTKLVQPAMRALEECQTRGGGKLEIRLVRHAQSVELLVEPGRSFLEPTVQHCALEALSTIDLPQTAGKEGGPALGTPTFRRVYNMPPTGFTSLITISW